MALSRKKWEADDFKQVGGFSTRYPKQYTFSLLYQI